MSDERSSVSTGDSVADLRVDQSGEPLVGVSVLESTGIWSEVLLTVIAFSKKLSVTFMTP